MEVIHLTVADRQFAIKNPDLLVLACSLASRKLKWLACYLVDSGWEITLSKVYLDSLLLSVTSMDQTPGLGPAGRKPCGKPCSSGGDTQEMSLSFAPLGRRCGQAKHPNREVTLRCAAPVKGWEAWPRSCSRSPQAPRSLRRHLLIPVLKEALCWILGMQGEGKIH